MSTADSPWAAVEASTLVEAVAAILTAAGAPEENSRRVAGSLVDADLEGVPSHGTMLVPIYVNRVLAGSVDPAARPEVVVDSDAVAVLDGRNGFGQVIGDKAMALAVEKAQKYGLGMVTVRHGFHFGTARRFALQAADAGCVGIVSCNTRPLMPPPGGAERLVGNNPLAVALPTSGEIPLVVDVALSEAAMGKIRIAEGAGRQIPATWATDAGGRPTTDPAAAIEGMLLPVGGHKGFGLAFVLDLIAGVLSGGAWGDRVQPLYGDPSVPYDSSHFFIAIDVGHFRAREEAEGEMAAAAERLRTSTPAAGTERLYSPGEPEWQRRVDAGGVAQLERSVLLSLQETAERVGIDPPQLDVNPHQGGDHAQD